MSVNLTPTQTENNIKLGSNSSDYFELGSYEVDSTINGLEGLDFLGGLENKSKYEIKMSNDKISITNELGQKHYLIGVERLIFSDTQIATLHDNKAIFVAKLISAVFGAESVKNENFVGFGLNALDNSMSQEDLISIALEERLGSDYSQEGVIEILYKNLFGVNPTLDEINSFTEKLNDGTYTTTSLTKLALENEQNISNILQVVGNDVVGISYKIPVDQANNATSINVSEIELSKLYGYTNGYFNSGDKVQLKVFFDGAINLDVSEGAPLLLLNIDGNQQQAEYLNTIGDNGIIFEYEFNENLTSKNGFSIEENGLLLNGSIIENPYGLPIAIAHQETSFDYYRIDSDSPEISLFSVRADSTGYPGDRAEFTFKGIREDGSIVKVYKDDTLLDQAVNNGEYWTYKAVLQWEEISQISIFAEDLAGNKSDPINSFTIKGDINNEATPELDLLETEVIGTLENDVLEGNVKNNKIEGLAGDDILRGGSGIDVMDGGDGDDVFIIVGDVTAGGKVDTKADTAALGFDISTLNFRDFNEDEDGSAETVIGGEGNDTLYVIGTADISNYSISGIETIEIRSDVAFDEGIFKGTGSVKTINGDGSSTLRIKGGTPEEPLVIDLSEIDAVLFKNIGQLDLGENVEIIIDSFDNLGGAQILTGSGKIKAKDAALVLTEKFSIQSTLTFTDSSGEKDFSGQAKQLESLSKSNGLGVTQGTDQDDYLLGSVREDIFYTGNGDDVIVGKEGNDTYFIDGLGTKIIVDSDETNLGRGDTVDFSNMGQSVEFDLNTGGKVGEGTTIELGLKNAGGVSSGVSHNLMIILDSSGSMRGSRIDQAKQAAIKLIEAYENVGDVSVRLIDFDSGATSSFAGVDAWMSGDQAKTFINQYFYASGGTNYQAAIDKAESAFLQGKEGQFNDQGGSVSYFLSDGQPYPGVSNSQRIEWENFLIENQITSESIGFGGIYNTSYLTPISFDAKLVVDSNGDGLVNAQDDYAPGQIAPSLEVNTSKLGDTLVQKAQLDFIENVVGSNSDDTIIVNSLDNRIDGLAGEDTVVFNGKFDDYNITFMSDKVVVQDKKENGDGNNELFNIEKLQFADLPPVDVLGNTPKMITSEQLFDNYSLFKDDSNGNSEGLFKVMFDLAVASYVHIDSLHNFKGMEKKPSDFNQDKLDYVQGMGITLLDEKDLGFDWTNNDSTSTITGSKDKYTFSEGFYLAFETDGIFQSSSSALIGRTEDSLFVTFRGSDVFEDWVDDFVDMEGHYQRYEPLIAKLEEYLNDPLNQVQNVYIGGHSLGGQMAMNFLEDMQESSLSSKINFQAITYEAANNTITAGLATPDSLPNNDSIINFEMHKDYVADLGPDNYGNTIYIEHEAVTLLDQLSLANHRTGVIDKYIDMAVSNLDHRKILDDGIIQNERIYLDNNLDGIIKTKDGLTSIDAIEVVFLQSLLITLGAFAVSPLGLKVSGLISSKLIDNNVSPEQVSDWLDNKLNNYNKPEDLLKDSDLGPAIGVIVASVFNVLTSDNFNNQLGIEAVGLDQKITQLHRDLNKESDEVDFDELLLNSIADFVGKLGDKLANYYELTFENVVAAYINGAQELLEKVLGTVIVPLATAALNIVLPGLLSAFKANDFAEYALTGYDFETVSYSGADEQILIIDPIGNSTISVSDDTVPGTIIISAELGAIDVDLTASGMVYGKILVGNEAGNTIFGGQGDDIVIGGADKDILYGGIGNDVLFGGTLTEEALALIKVQSQNHLDNATLYKLDALMAKLPSLSVFDVDNFNLDNADQTILRGGEGQDILIGNDDNDFFFVDADYGASNNDNVDFIFDFYVAEQDSNPFKEDYLVFSDHILGIDSLADITSGKKNVFSEEAFVLKSGHFLTVNGIGQYEINDGKNMEAQFILDTKDYGLYFDSNGSQDVSDVALLAYVFEDPDGGTMKDDWYSLVDNDFDANQILIMGHNDYIDASLQIA